MIAVIDYGAGNLHSVVNALKYLGAECEITRESEKILRAERVILPGVGAFGDAMKCIEQRGLTDTIRTAANGDRPFLGICLGLQLLFERSEESPGVKGLGVFRGSVVRIPETGLKIPHMGWNNITLTKKSRILPDDKPYVYFVHSYYIRSDEPDAVSAYTEYGTRLDVAVERGNVFATQFHPEKSGAVGMEILRKFLSL